MEAGGSVGGCSFITVVTIEEPEPKTAPMGEGELLGGVMLRKGEVAEKEGGGSSNRSLPFSAELSSGSGRKPGQRETENTAAKLLELCFLVVYSVYLLQ